MGKIENTENVNIDNTEELTNIDYTQEEITENIEYEGEDNNVNTEEEKPFSVDDIEFGDEYKIANYDFSKYKDVLSPESLPIITEYAKKYSEKGFTQEQIEFLLEEQLEEQNNVKTKENVMKELNNYLTFEEKQSYRIVGTQVKQALEKSGLSKYYEEIMTNPIAFKVINSILRHNSGGANIKPNTEIEGRKITSLTGYQAVEEFNKYLNENLGNADKESKIKELMSKLTNEQEKKYFKEILGI